MAKMLADTELAQIVVRATNEDLLDEADQYRRFLEGLGDLIADFVGAERSCVSFDEDAGWLVGFNLNECVPEDGGVFNDYDTDVTWKR